MGYRYTDKEIKQILKTLVVITDTREQSNAHIKTWFDAKKVQHKEEAMRTGDYTCMIPRNVEMGISRDLYLDDVITVERKGSLEEISGNFSQGRERFKDEMTRKRGRLYLLVEGARIEDIYKGTYNTGLKQAAFIAAIKSFEAKYNISTHFIDKEYAGAFIFHTLYYHARAYLLGEIH